MKQLIQLYKDSYTGFSKDIWLLTLFTLINRSGTMVLLFMSLYLKQELNYDYQEVGIVMAFFGLGSFTGAYLGGLLTDKIGYYRVLYLSQISVGLCFFLLLTIESFYPLCFMFFLTATIGDAFRPANYAAVKAYSKKENQTRSLTVVRLAVNLGFSVGPVVGGILSELYGFHWVFILDGTTCIVSGVFILIFLSHKKIEKEASKKEEVVKASISVLSNKRYLAFLASVFFTGMTFFQMFTTFPVFLEEQYGYNKSVIGGIIALNGVLIVIFEMPLVFVLEKKYRKLVLVIIGTALITAAFAFMALPVNWFIIPIIAVVLITFGEMINFPFASSWALNQSQTDNSGKYMGAFSMNFALAHIVAPIIGFGLIDYYGFSIMWTIMAILSIVAIIGLYLVKQMPKPVAKAL